ncbi:hypothetical protein CAPTEDRAFT_193576 [Capitella teleta]|uniref:Enoyl reductase (ER) domain-containing protein n=1 Tax=Capitella teleta TaxID=283909 RepID=R7UIS7_CAPTE|nr:hypothetical protein CAPTEDRAFT_193576 [Capitella teleta]|eukprot:ELU06060.1 hypothetical protein CAPTEDRAFT_193576 [Capitella teleta]
MASFRCPPELLLRNASRSAESASTASHGAIKRAAVVMEIGKPLEVQDLPVKALNPGQVRLSVKYAAMNFADILQSQGKYQSPQKPPYVPGSEFAGVVTEVATGVDGFRVGDHVTGILPEGTFQEEAVTTPQVLGVVPKSLDLKMAAGFLISYGTAYLAFTKGVPLREGDTVLVTAAAGSTGLAAVDLAANVFGCKVIAACGSEEKCRVAQEKGAFATINYGKESLKQRMKEITAGKGANAIFECVGGNLFRECLSRLTMMKYLKQLAKLIHFSIAFSGTLLPIGFTSGDIPTIPANLILVKNIRVVGVFWGSHAQRDPESFQASVQGVSKLLFEGKIQPRIGDVFPLDKVNDAVQFILSRKSTGKVLIDVQSK